MPVQKITDMMLQSLRMQSHRFVSYSTQEICFNIFLKPHALFTVIIQHTLKSENTEAQRKAHSSPSLGLWDCKSFLICFL